MDCRWWFRYLSRT